jgi:hypothetical protein
MNRRPYDCPIKDFDLPAQQAPQLKAYGFTCIVCSPFRRCLQTAGVVAQALGIKEVVVHLGVGEVMNKVRNAIKEVSAGAADCNVCLLLGSISHNPSVGDDGMQLEYLEEDAMEQVLSRYGVGLKAVEGDRPPMDEVRALCSSFISRKVILNLFSGCMLAGSQR